jgi:hypothetical protein
VRVLVLVLEEQQEEQQVVRQRAPTRDGHQRP